MDLLTGFSRPTDEISIYCPVRLCLGDRSFDGLLDSLDSRGGNFYVLTDDDPASPGTEARMALQKHRRGELLLGTGPSALRIPCRVRGMRFDEDGLYVYVGLRFMQEAYSDRRLGEFIAALW